MRSRCLWAKLSSDTNRTTTSPYAIVTATTHLCGVPGGTEMGLRSSRRDWRAEDHWVLLFLGGSLSPVREAIVAMLPRLHFAQVGDVHLPGVLTATRNLDDKDPRFPVELRNQISRQPTRRVGAAGKRRFLEVSVGKTSQGIRRCVFNELSATSITSGFVPRGLSRVETARYIGVSPGTFDKLVDDGSMPKPSKSAPGVCGIA